MIFEKKNNKNQTKLFNYKNTWIIDVLQNQNIISHKIVTFFYSLFENTYNIHKQTHLFIYRFFTTFFIYRYFNHFEISLMLGYSCRF